MVVVPATAETDNPADIITVNTMASMADITLDTMIATGMGSATGMVTAATDSMSTMDATATETGRKLSNGNHQWQ